MNGRPSPDQTSRSRRRDQRGAVLPTPVVWLSIVAIVVAAVAFVSTRDDEPKEREVTSAPTSSSSDPSSSSGEETDETSEPPTQTPSDDDETATDEPTTSETPEEPKKTKEPVERADYGVVVFNNTTISGLASEVLTKVGEIGWQAVAADNWYGTIPATTVYFPAGMRDAAQKLALDLGVQRLVPADPAMSTTNLTLILTGPID
ncbi:LytR family transcriptional regulator [Nocardioides humilatus]|uniref:LytR family transcriptional regulator n=1 Tax=Nocardioides humilatus TaxID=2607660 RepID=A0A5B1LHG5_9ACTN|nr:LytR C-terminal domain-containing protein [Nocardioides humilatus]KAA1419089.1 LytR family transcriptional regulator [Nocardioides humilatus]